MNPLLPELSLLHLGHLRTDLRLQLTVLLGLLGQLALQLLPLRLFSAQGFFGLNLLFM